MPRPGDIIDGFEYCGAAEQVRQLQSLRIVGIIGAMLDLAAGDCEESLVPSPPLEPVSAVVEAIYLLPGKADRAANAAFLWTDVSISMHLSLHALFLSRLHNFGLGPQPAKDYDSFVPDGSGTSGLWYSLKV